MANDLVRKLYEDYKKTGKVPNLSNTEKNQLRSSFKITGTAAAEPQDLTGGPPVGELLLDLLLPSAGAAAANVALPGSGLVARAGLSALGGAIGRGAQQKLTSPEKSFDIPDILRTSGLFGAGEVGAPLIGKVAGVIGKAIKPVAEKGKEFVADRMASVLNVLTKLPEAGGKKLLSETSKVMAKETLPEEALSQSASVAQKALKIVKRNASIEFQSLKKDLPELSKIKINKDRAENFLKSALKKEGVIPEKGADVVTKAARSISQDKYGNDLKSILDTFRKAKKQGLTFDQAELVTRRINRILSISSADDVAPISTELAGVLRGVKSILKDSISKKVPGFTERNAKYAEFRDLHDYMQPLLKTPEKAERTASRYVSKELGKKGTFRDVEFRKSIRELEEKSGIPFTEDMLNVGTRREFETAEGIPALLRELAVKPALRFGQGVTTGGRFLGKQVLPRDISASTLEQLLELRNRK